MKKYSWDCGGMWGYRIEEEETGIPIPEYLAVEFKQAVAMVHEAESHAHDVDKEIDKWCDQQYGINGYEEEIENAIEAKLHNVDSKSSCF